VININDIIQQRRSIFPKEYTGQILDTQVVETLLQNAGYAPNHYSNYPWRFIIITGDGLSDFIDKASDIYRLETPAETFKPEKLDKLQINKERISHIVAIVMHRDPEVKSIEREDICAVACAVQNMHLSLSQFPEAGGYWSTGMGTNSPTMHSFLKLEANDTLLGYFVLGHVVNKRTEAHKKNISHFLRYL
jgi:nitroreductase